MKTKRFISIISEKHEGAIFVKDTKYNEFVCKFYKGQDIMAKFYINQMNRLDKLKKIN